MTEYSYNNESDWQSAFSCATEQVVACEGFTGSLEIKHEDISEIVRSDPGENDYTSWICVGKLNDGRWFFLTAWCDYTGWGCRDGGTIYVGDSEEMVKTMGCDDEARQRLYDQEVKPFPLEWLTDV